MNCLFLSGEFSGEEGSRTGEWDSVEWWSQVQAKTGEHTTSPQVVWFPEENRKLITQFLLSSNTLP